MAVLNLPPLSPLDVYSHMTSGDDTQLKIHNIKGQALVANYMIDDYKIMNGVIPTDDEVKLRLCNELVKEMFERKMIEFTKEKTVHGTIHYRARIFAVPNTNVQLLREQGIIK